MEHLNFYVYQNGFKINPSSIEESYITLFWDNWNDFSYKTRFRVYLKNREAEVLLGDIKVACSDILRDKRIKDNKLEHLIGRKSSFSNDDNAFYDYNLLVPKKFQCLEEGFFSLGSVKFYESLNNIDQDIREYILTSLNDLAYNFEKLAPKYLDKSNLLPVVEISFLRDIDIEEIKYQLVRLVEGGVYLDKYSINVDIKSITNKNMSIDFEVTPNSIPPTNLHAVIGTNSAGKSHLLRQVSKQYIAQKNTPSLLSMDILNLVCISFSPFDRVLQNLKIDGLDIRYIGLRKNPVSNDFVEYKSKQIIENEFIDNFLSCNKSSRKCELWRKVLKPLESDYLFNSIKLSNWQKIKWFEESLKDEEKVKSELLGFFYKLGSGHRIILLILVILINTLKEKTLVLFDEPETYLHPPLLASLMRSLSLLTISRNGMMILATHSPVVLQELPSKCVWKIQRFGDTVNYFRPSIETFGENSSIINREIFNIETEKSGFVALIDEIVEEIDVKNIHGRDTKKLIEGLFQECLERFNNKLGDEGKVLLLSKLVTKINKDRNKDV